MEKLFCDECDREMKTSFAGHSVTLDEPVPERTTRIFFEIKGEEYNTNNDKFAKSLPIEHLCKICTIKYIKMGLELLEKEFEWDGKS